LWYWQSIGVFPKAKVTAEGVMSLYDNDQIEAGFKAIGKREGVSKVVQQEDIEWAKEQVLKQNRSKNISLLLNKIKKEA
jgi:hypothetical protein